MTYKEPMHFINGFSKEDAKITELNMISPECFVRSLENSGREDFSLWSK
jgi:hypothetical protein